MELYIIFLIFMKIAILHDLLVKLGWAEKVLEKVIKMYPNADLFTLIYDEKKVWKIFPKEKIKHVPKITQNIYDLTKNQRLCLPFMARAIESIDLSNYDVVIAFNSAFVHWAITKPETKFIVYYHSPTRYLWDWTNEYKRDIWWNKWIKWFILNSILKNIRLWDYIASKRHNITLANSFNVKKRIKKYYWLDAWVVYPNVDIDRFNTVSNITSMPNWEDEKKLPKDYYIIISALTEFKKVDLSIKAFNGMSDKNLIIVWDWNFKENLKKIAWNNIYFTWYKSDDEVVYLLQNSLGLIFSWEEDFWIVPIEAFGAWKPVFAYKAWWLTETMVEWITWEFFLDNNWWDFIKNFKVFDENIKNNKYNPLEIKEVALKYSTKNFEDNIRKIVWF